MQFFDRDGKTFSKGENAFECGHVQSMDFDAELMLIRGSVQASMKNKVYKVEVAIDGSGNVSSSLCSCPKGIKCHHMAALLLFGHYNISITDKLCTWRNTKGTSEQTLTCDELYPKKPYCAIDRKMTNEEKKELTCELNRFGATVGFSWLLQESQDKASSVSTLLIENIIFSKEFSSAENKGNFLKEKCRLNNDVIEKVMNETTGQSENENWFLVRKHRLTASNFGMILLACQRNRYPESLFKSLYGIYNLDGVKAIQWGRTHESVAVENFESSTKLKVVPTGIWLSQSGFLGASPDGLVGEDCIIEVKCPYSHRNDELPHKLKNIKNYIIYFDDAGDLHVNHKHHYYHQIQGLLHILNKSACYLVVWTLKGSIIAIIKKDLTWECNLQILENFYINQYIPKLVQNIM